MTRTFIEPRNGWDCLPPEVGDSLQDFAAEQFAAHTRAEFRFDGWPDLALIERVAARAPLSPAELLRAMRLLKAEAIAKRAGLAAKVNAILSGP